MVDLQFIPHSLTVFRGVLHVFQIIACLLTLLVGIISPKPLHTFWIYCVVVWALCPLITLFITLVELCLLHKLILYLCMDWDDFTTGMAMMATLATFTCAVSMGVFYVCLSCPWGLLITLLSGVCCFLYGLEVYRDKRDGTRSATYVAALPGFLQVLEAHVSCVIFISLTGYVSRPVLLWCVVAYIVPFPILPVIIITNIMKCLKSCLPFSIDNFVLIFLVLSVLLYGSAAVVWPVFTFRGNPRPKDCYPKTCIWNIQFLVAVMTCVNLVLFVVDLVFTLLGIFGFRRP